MERKERRLFVIAGPALLSLAFLFSASLASAQASASQSYTISAHSALSAAETLVSGMYQAHSAIGQLSTGAISTSASYQALGGVVWVPPPSGLTSANPPLVFSVEPKEGSYVGGDQISIIGANFADPGAGATAVLFDGVPATGVVVVSDNLITALTPPGFAPVSLNPSGPIDVGVQNGNGGGTLKDGYTFSPSITINPAQPSIGKPAIFKGYFFEDSITQAVAGLTLPGVFFTVPGLTGAAEVLLGPVGGGPLTVVPPTVAPGGVLEQQFTFTDPSVAGVSLTLQALGVSLVTPGSGAFTNVLQTTIQP